MKHTKQKNLKTTLALSVAALGVVYGDIGTSPLYAVNQIFFGTEKSADIQHDILGPISIIFWALTIVISFKYIILVLRADNEGEGGVFALYGLLNQLKKRSIAWLTILLALAAGLLFGDGIITPAISVISSVEGLRIATTAFDPYIVPITIAILTGLFLIQRNGTSKVGTVFGPIIFIWFASIAALGLVQVIHHPSILQALNPAYALGFFMHYPLYTLLITLGAIMLVVTGGEALYADMGHFGATPIRISWFTITYPALLLNYFGQGAYLISGAKVIQGNIFFSMVPHWALYPMIIISTLATIIASQALISGAFSLSTQAISLGLFPYLKVKHTHEDHAGQIYVPFINWALYIGCCLLVVTFRSSASLASAYGLAVSGVMLVTTMSMVYISRYYWNWGWFRSLVLFVPLSLVDVSFLVANSLKFIEGGYIPLLIGLSLMIIMQTWQWGRKRILKAFNTYPCMTVEELIQLKRTNTQFVPRSEIIMTANPIESSSNKIPVLKQLYSDRHGLIAKNIIFVTAVFNKVPHITKERYSIKKFYEDKTKGTILSVKINFGFMEEPNVESMLEGIANHELVNINDHHKKWNIHVLYERARLTENANIFDLIRFNLFKFLQRNSDTADHYLELGKEHALSIEVIPVIIK
jgi:KUP system potassium uptake protein